MSVELFLNTLFHNKPDKDWVLLWEKRPDKKVSYWFDLVPDAIQHFKIQGLKQDTYVGCGTATRTLPTFRRCTAAEISGIPAAWIDVDILNPVHAKINLPDTKQKALEIIEPFPLKPTITVYSGHGYQFWWVFDKFAKFTSDRMHEEASSLLHKFTWTIRDIARSMGYDIDMTFDLSRVFRVPGGLNFKDDPPKAVTLENCTRDFYSFQEFHNTLEQFRMNLGSDATPIGERKKTVVSISNIVQGETFTMDPNANPPLERLKLLTELDHKFAASWEHRRRDFKGDDSPSVYDLSLASFAYANDWTQQEIVDLLIAFRRNNGIKPKLVESYYRRTLLAASNAQKDKESFDALAEIVDDVKNNLYDAKTPEEKALIADRAKTAIQTILKIKFLRILKYNVNPPEFKLEMENACVHLGGILNVIKQPFFKAKLAESIGVYLRNMKEDKWEVVAQAMLNICEVVSAGEDTSSRGLMKFWLQNFFEHHAPLYDMTDGMLSHRPFYFKDSLYLFGPDLRSYIAMYHKELIAQKTMGIMLREYGFTPLSLNIKPDKVYVTRAAWKIEIARDKIAQSFLDIDMLHNANELALEAQALKDKERIPF